MRAKEANAIIMSKDDDFLRLVESIGPPPSSIWITCGNSSNNNMRLLLTKYFLLELDLIKSGEKLVEIGSRD